MSNQGQGTNLKDCKDCAAAGVITKVLWVDNPAKPGGRMPVDYNTLLTTGQHVRHNCPYWKKTGTIPATATVTAPAPVPQIADSRMTQIPLPQGQATLPTTTAQLLGSLPSIPLNLRIEPNSHTDSIFTNLVLALQGVADELAKTNQFLEILANKEVKKNPGIKSALQAKTEDDRVIHGQELLHIVGNVQKLKKEEKQERLLVPNDPRIHYPDNAEIAEPEPEEFDEEQLEEETETETSKRNRERNEDDFPPL